MRGIDHRHRIEQHRILTLRGRTWRIIGRLGSLGALVVCGIASAGVPVQAADDIVVPRDFPTIQAAVDAAAPGSTIKVRPGTIK